MSLENNKVIVRRYIEQIWSEGDRIAALELLASDYIDHNPPPGVKSDREGLLQALDIFIAAFPSAKLTVDEIVAEGDIVADRWTLHGTQHGDFFGIAPTGKSVTLTGMDFHRIIDAMITETWHVEDILGLLRQLGTSTK